MPAASSATLVIFFSGTPAWRTPGTALGARVAHSLARDRVCTTSPLRAHCRDRHRVRRRVSAVHYRDQGLPGVEQAAFTGLVFGTIFAITTRIWLLMVAHAAFDVTAVVIICWNLEAKVAHLVFT